jgi:hypothetical protein
LSIKVLTRRPVYLHLNEIKNFNIALSDTLN